jgi:hypothetical protein
MSLSIEQLKEKIAAVESDLTNLRADHGNDRKISTLADYIAYLKDDLRFLEQEQRQQHD